jgi:hypothetical protein
MVGGFDRHHLCQTNNAVLGRDVCRLLGTCNEAVRQGDVDYSAPASAFHPGQYAPTRMESGRQIRGDHSVPLLDREILQLRHELDARIVNQDINCSEGLFGVAISTGWVISAPE